VNTQWRKFISVTFPVTLIFIALLVEVFSYLLKDVPLRRHDLDRLVVALQEGDAINSPTVLLGDSITQDVLKNYRIAPKGEVANLTTNKANGVVGSMFLLERYLEKNTPPKRIVLASTPEFFGYDPEGKAAEVYLTSVFNKIEEQKWLLRYMSNVFDNQKIEPAIMNIEGKIGYKILALLASAPDSLVEGSEIPNQIPVLELSPVHPSIQRGIDSRANNSLVLSKIVGTALINICKIAPEADLYILVAPMPKTTYLQRKGKGEINKLKNEIFEYLKGNCSKIHFIDINEYRIFPNIAMRDSDHLRRPGWTAEYARLLKQIIKEIESDYSQALQ
jgi:hypothetical protein